MRNKENHMELAEVQEWCEKGRPLNDAAFGLLFKAIDVSIRTQGEDLALPAYFSTIRSLIQAEIAQELRHIRKLLEKGV